MQEITRRDAIAMGAAGTLAAACSGAPSANPRHIAVVGAGIVGASIAYHLATAGAQVTVLERHDIATRASRGTFAWLNATWAKQPRHYHRLNQLGLAGWQQLERDLAIPIKWGGSIEWFGSEERQAVLEDQIAEQVEWGEPASMIGRDELARLEPRVEFGATTRAAFSPNDGALDPVFAARTLLDNAKARRAQVRTRCGVRSASKSGGDQGAILSTEQGDLEVDAFVLATGADPDACEKLAGIAIPQRSTPGVIVITEPAEPILERILVAPGVHAHQRPDGRIVLGEQDGAPDTQAHAARLAQRPNLFPSREIALQHAQRILTVADQYLPGISQNSVEDVFIGWRPLPIDGHPVVGFSSLNPNAYLAIAHSGVTLAPILGRLAAQEIMGGTASDLLTPYRPDRSFENVRRY